ncbi:tRNA (adenosine(37)-N6)-threonylcarbamoyltransferase complex dimerization subunit type 1 TsaB [Ochrobactrum oryzae]|uniref:tRNA (Adenosine(37)-N6)-threonylcarbamoyltransferase complex dimerization subunit type 1 TsaB n=1 Tax=Brucella oryzae TaxID=335286 RepID=A0A2S7J270_9HYPH|nr:tRNA (adenosine(37)-N6)-threonylcarbamoyltransferase complex dimerization subunit type 1 TsaB [Brucella oryzae]MBR7653200.1 tRNA (adenosine(37)-N6)-threonylcarbamoyltransferase complex dimerization subunit type 1 TsaB [Brucella oryzae]NKC21744.1 tRNA (adenosine(37)-N6)-threonylcarbamoyltransferase complex dimerization subunit type 1 TsaB [Brucella oryzae]PQA74296.1 tRNA (adenosine(37)-N6)-threonylcarbamoyltransferase complex dimerization subunit type 1 TsaB [Brucella oryzae]
MKILALDTAASWCSVAVYDSDGDVVLADVSENIGKGHAEVLMDYVERAVTEAKLSLREMDRVAVNIGPGSFTGVRIGVSAARGFALALGVPAIGITAFEALAAEAQSLSPEKPVLVVLDAHRGEIYAQSFNAKGLPSAKPLVLSREEAEALAASQAKNTVLAGSAAPAINDVIDSRFTLGPVEPTAKIGIYARLASSRQPGDAPKPLYMRGPDAKPQIGFALPRKATGE